MAQRLATSQGGHGQAGPTAAAGEEPHGEREPAAVAAVADGAASGTESDARSFAGDTVLDSDVERDPAAVAARETQRTMPQPCGDSVEPSPNNQKENVGNFGLCGQLG